MLRAILLVAAVLAAGCGQPTPTGGPGPGEEESRMAEMTLTSTAFQAGQPIPERYTCDDQNHSPPLRFDGVPHDAQSLILVMDDPDAPAGTWLHWLVYGLPPSVGMLVEAADVAKAGGKEGKNSWDRTGYGGPCPPDGKHRYFFRLWAVDHMLGLDAGATRDAVEEAMEGHVLAEAQLMGTYERAG